MSEWNADAYHRISVPQQTWGRRVLQRLQWRGDEVVLDAGCGTGRLTALLLESVPHGRVIALDGSMNMARVARDELSALFDGRVLVLQSDLLSLPLRESVDVVFSTATFHWIVDHDRLFRELFTALRPHGRLVAQCGGGPNLARLYAHAEVLMASDAFRRFFAGWREPWLFADAATTAARLRAAGFTEVETSLEEAPTPFESAPAFREFVTNVVFRLHLQRLPDQQTRDRFMDAIVERAAADRPPLTLDYRRLNLAGRKPRR